MAKETKEAALVILFQIAFLMDPNLKRVQVLNEDLDQALYQNK